MTRLVWNESGYQHYQSGLDRGVFYPFSGNGLAWNGLIQIDEQVEGQEAQALYVDGRKYLDYYSGKDFKATLQAFSFPIGFEECIGEKAIRPGVFLAQQPRSRFGFTYRSMVGTSEYKIHLVYNATASFKGRSSRSLSRSTIPENLELQIDTVPILNDSYRATAHLVVDSAKTDPTRLAELEGYLYGDDSDFVPFSVPGPGPRLPDPLEVQFILHGGDE